MWNNVIGRHIRRTNRTLLAVNGGIVLLLCALAVLNARYLFNFFLGPFPADRRTLTSITDPANTFDYYVTAEGQIVPPAIGRDIERRVNKYTRKVESERVTAEYVVVAVSNRLLVVKVPGTADPSQRQFTGAVVPMPGDMWAKLTQNPEAKQHHLDDVFLPYMLDATGFRTGGWIALAVGLPLYVLGMWNVIRAFRRMAKPERHPVSRSLTRFGTPDEVAAAIGAEVKELGYSPRGNVTLSRSWLLHATTFGLQVRHVNELVWVYKKVTKHRVNFIPTSSTYAAVICTSDGATLEVPGSLHIVENLLEDLLARAPWVLAGYDAQLAGYWQSDPGGVVAAVDERRRQLQGEPVLDAQPAPEDGQSAAGPEPSLN